ncbi:MAG TPA: inositol monophosphatase family protein [Longimicrobiaceae bacterium]
MIEAGEAVSFAAELTVAKQAAADAAQVLLRAATPATVREKQGAADLVTEVDEQAERLILERLKRHFPGDRFVAEESSAGALRHGERTWIIDPLDGTTNFVHGHPFACVSIAFADTEGLAVGVVHAPFLGEVYHAVRGGGAYLNERPLQVSAVAEGPAGLYATGFPFKAGKGDPELYFRLVADMVASSHGVRRAGSAALDCAFVAAGRLEGYFEIGVSAWDVAGGLLLVTEAGGRVTGWPGDTEPPLQTGRVLATNGKVHGWLEEKVGRAGL